VKIIRGILFLCCLSALNTSAQYVTVKNKQFKIQNKPYHYIGTNYWYGGYLFPDTLNDGKKRLINELNFLQKKGINNLRIMMSSEGDGTYEYRISPAIQGKQGLYNMAILVGFDFLLFEMKKRNMKAIMVLTNNWEWSGGMGQYLEWAGCKNPPLPKTSLWDWDNYCEYISKFYNCDSCNTYFRKYISMLLNRTNTFTKTKYKNDQTIMAWELANEPRPMKKTANEYYYQWIKNTSEYIKSIDKNHLVTTGVEGVIGTSQDSNLFIKIHQLKSIDYATMHIWPKTWAWYGGNKTDEATNDTTLSKSLKYVKQHIAIMNKIEKPLVLEEFGMHRDGNSFDKNATTKHRDIYYSFLLKELQKSISNNESLQGCNFWGFAGLQKNKKDIWWKLGMPYTADPPQEEQGLYAVFETDTTTWKVITSFTQSLFRK
jgi:mannan endo-1,4-beta-mannosidase